MDSFIKFMDSFIKLCNDNSGFISVVIFLLTVILGWATGLFQSLINRPIFRITVIDDGPSFCCNFQTGRDYKTHKAHRTAIALYLDVTNVGTAPSSIRMIRVGYHNKTFRYTFRWFWMKLTASLIDFHIPIGNTFKVYPYLIQKNALFPHDNDTYLEVGKSRSGVVYFEQEESWGEFRPKVRDNSIDVKILVYDSFGKSHFLKTKIPNIPLEKARQFNPRFGETLETLGS